MLCGVTETLWMLVPDCVIVLLSEMLVDWLKHAFITRFNELPFLVYRDYTLSLAYDMAQTRQKNVGISQNYYRFIDCLSLS